FDRGAARRMCQPQPLGVKSLPIEQYAVGLKAMLGQFAQGELGLAAIEPVAQHRAADAGQVQANLMRSAGFRPAANRREALEALDDLVKRPRRPAACGIAAGRHLLTLVRMMA